MNSRIVALIAILFIITSCSKESNPVPGLIGTWQWKASYIGSPVNTETPANTGINETLSFDGKNWSQSQNSVIVNSGTYRIVSENDINTIHYQPNGTGADSIEYFQITEHSLIFSQDFSGQGSIGAGSKLYSK